MIFIKKYEKTGYLHHDFKIFHLTDHEMTAYDFHYHDFHKLLFFLSGNVTYCIEGKSYQLAPGDLVLVRAGEVHRPVIHDITPYERMIIYVSPDFAAASSDKTFSLNQCFLPDAAMPSNVLHLSGMKDRRLLDTLTELVHSFSEDGFANELYQNTLFLEFMIHLNRSALSGTLQYEDSFQANKKILSVLTYMNEHLTEDITVDSLAEHFFTSRYYLMHSFKEQTGYTIGNYLSTKRLLFARDLISSGTAVTDACFACGFHNYSTFLRAYKKQFGKSPREMIS